MNTWSSSGRIFADKNVDIPAGEKTMLVLWSVTSFFESVCE